jgi:hypothetical protein
MLLLLSRSWFVVPQPALQEPTMTRSVPRRTLLMLSVAGASVALAGRAQAQAQALLDEKDPQAAALGYVGEAKRADAKKYPKYAAGQNCAVCALYQGKAADKAGGCPLFGAKQVAGAGWCSAWAKKA